MSTRGCSRDLAFVPEPAHDFIHKGCQLLVIEPDNSSTVACARASGAGSAVRTTYVSDSGVEG